MIKLKFLRNKKFVTLLTAIFFIVLLVGGIAFFGNADPTPIDDGGDDIFPEIGIKIVKADDDDTDDDDDAKEDAQEEIDDAKEELQEARDEAKEMYQDGEITESAYDTVSNKLDAAENNLDVAEDQFEKGHYKQAEKKADDCKDKVEEAMDWLDDHKTKGENTDDEDEANDNDINDVDDIIDGIEDITDNETPEEDALERSLILTLTINGQNALLSSRDSPVQIDGTEPVTIYVKVQNTGNVDLVTEEITITTTASGIRVNKITLVGGSLNAGGITDTTSIVEVGDFGTFLGSLDSNIFKSHIEVEFEGDWDYELNVYWQLV